MSPRLKLRAAAKPLLLAGALWSAAAATPVAAAGRPQTPPPCGPDGVCVPNPATYGVYPTRWRPFPGDAVQGPTAADRKAEGEKENELRGPQPPEMMQEGILNRAPPKRAGQPTDEPAMPDPNEDIRNLPGLPPLPGPNVGPAPAPAGAPAGDPAGGLFPGGALPGAEPESDPLNPLGGTPTTPAWLGQTMANPAARELVPLPHVEAASEQVVWPVENIEPWRETLPDAPNLQGDDAPPAPPSTLRRITGMRLPFGRPSAQPAPAATAAAPAPAASALSQPRSLQAPAAGGVRQASAVIPAGGQLTNPAGIMEAIAEDRGAQQAIYFEASDGR